MGKKINPKVFRLKNVFNWDSRWYSDKNFSNLLEQDVKITDYLKKKLLPCFVSGIEIERAKGEVTVIIYSARPGMIIGKNGVGIEELKKEISRQFIKDKKIKVNLNIKEVKKPNWDSSLVAQGIKFDIEKRMPFRRAVKQAVGKVQRAGALGIKVIVSGRLNGAEIARREMFVTGKIPLHTLRANIDYTEEKAYTTYGVIGIKVWIYKGDVFSRKKQSSEENLNNNDQQG